VGAGTVGGACHLAGGRNQDQSQRRRTGVSVLHACERDAERTPWEDESVGCTRGPSTAHADSLRSAACFAQDDKANLMTDQFKEDKLNGPATKKR
jgi:hypothetical protein